MKHVVRACAGAACSFLLMHPAAAQWQGKAGLGLRHASHAEYEDERTLVRERGWLPGLVLEGACQAGNVAWFAGADWYRAGIGYRGQTQSGTAARSRTATTLATLRLGARYQLAADTALMAALEADLWRRDIRSTGSAAGLQERYRSGRFVVGAAQTWRPAAGLILSDLALVLSTPERMRVDFHGLLDQATLSTRRAPGLRAGASFNPGFSPNLELRAAYDWMRIGRSGDAPLTRNGRFAGTVAQPEHVRQGVSLTLSRLF
ncbi:hypothetical protein [Massilia suwonensis]|uniref:Outer membrane protein OmpA-like transmembrane domain-containing protein n=1 Tax=Massilia suwonensis TaxID=648895 RepID=A0ABW0MKG3_9BURK